MECDPNTLYNHSLAPPEELELCHDVIIYEELLRLRSFSLVETVVPRHWCTDDPLRVI